MMMDGILLWDGRAIFCCIKTWNGNERNWAGVLIERRLSGDDDGRSIVWVREVGGRGREIRLRKFRSEVVSVSGITCRGPAVDCQQRD